MADNGEMSFWDHLDELRDTIFKSLVAVTCFSVVVFCFKSFVFDTILLAPTKSTFPVYRLMKSDFSMDLINYDVSAQFFIHLRVAIIVGIVLAFPYVIYQIWKFIAPALFEREKRAVRKAFLLSGFLFYLGVVIGYFVVLPFALNFFNNYSVSEVVTNNISLSSYVSTFMSMVFMFGVVFEFPAVIAALSSMGILSKKDLRKGRKYAVIATLVLGAVVTPADPMSMIIAAAPLYLLYEASIVVCGKENLKNDINQ